LAVVRWQRVREEWFGGARMVRSGCCCLDRKGEDRPSHWSFVKSAGNVNSLNPSWRLKFIVDLPQQETPFQDVI